MKKRWLIVLLAATMLMVIGFVGCGTMQRAPAGQVRSVDVVVVGSGFAGYSAAIAAMVENPNLSMIMIEKNPFIGGISRTAAGNFNWYLWNAEHMTREQFEEGYRRWQLNAAVYTTGMNPERTAVVPIGDPDAAAVIDTRILPTCDLYPNFGKFHWLMQQSKRAYTFLIEQGMSGAVGVNAGSDAVLPGQIFESRGTGRIASMEMRLRELGVETELNKRAVRLLQNAQGEVTGVVYVHNGVESTINARRVILATGGFSQNLDLVKELTPANLGGRTNSALRYVINQAGPVNSTGDGIIMARALNPPAALYRSSFTAVTHPTMSEAFITNTLPNHYQQVFNRRDGFVYSSPMARVQQIFVDGNGVRFRRESAGLHNRGGGHGSHFMIIHNTFPNWFIYSAAHVDNSYVYTPVSNNRVNMRAALEAATAADAPAAIRAEVRRGNTLMELAVEMGIPADRRAAFVRMVEEYDAAVAVALAGGAWVDPLTLPANHHPMNLGNLGKPAGANNANLVRFNQGPFFAVKFYPGTFDSTGGIVTCRLGRVLTQYGNDNSFIPNLYAIGGVSNRDFFQQNYVSGSSQTLYTTVGYITGKHVARSLR